MFKKENINKKFLKIHESKKNRLFFKWSYIGWCTFLILLFLICGLLFSLYGVIWSDDGFVNPENAKIIQILCLVFGLILFIISICLALFSNYFIITKYKISKENYSRTDEFKKQCEDINKQNLTKISKKNLKWYYKLGYIQKEKYLIILEEVKNIKKENK